MKLFIGTIEFPRPRALFKTTPLPSLHDRYRRRRAHDELYAAAIVPNDELA